MKEVDEEFLILILLHDQESTNDATDGKIKK